MLYGRFSDIIGRKTALCLALFVFMVGTLAAGLSRTLVQLLIFRGIAGAGGGGIISLVQIVIGDMVAFEDRPKYQTIIGGIIAFGYAIGPLISGALLERFPGGGVS
jgi:MFS family permease